MLFMFKGSSRKTCGITNKEFYTVWSAEAQAALPAVKSGAIKGIYKATGQPVVIIIMDVPAADNLDRVLHELPIWKLGYAHIVKILRSLHYAGTRTGPRSLQAAPLPSRRIGTNIEQRLQRAKDQLRLP